MTRTYPPLPNRLGAKVYLKTPKGAPDAVAEIGTVIKIKGIDVVDHDEWGAYWYFAEKIDFPAYTQIRLAYYYLPPDADRWIFGGQYSVMDSPRTIKEICRAALEL